MQHLATRTAAELLREGVTASKEGNETLARQLFLQAAADDPSDESAWICLASITDPLHLRISYIQRALEINPDNTRGRILLEAARKKLAEAMVDKAKDAVKAGNQTDAAHFLLCATEFDSANDDSWIGLACLNGPVEDREIILRQALQKNPVNERLQSMLRTIEQRRESNGSAPPTQPAPAAETTIAPLTLEQTEEPLTVTPLPDAVESLELDGYPNLPPSLDTDVQIEVIEDEFAPTDEEPAGTDEPELARLEIESASLEMEAEQTETPRLTLEPSPEPPAPVSTVTLPESPGQTPIADPPAAIPDGCPLCMEALTGTPERCPSCGGRLKLWDPRVDSKDFAATRVDQRKMLLAVNRCSVTLRNDPQNSQLHYTLGLAYLNLNRLDVALRCLKRSEELNPSAELKAQLDRLSGPPSAFPVQLAQPETPRPLTPESTVAPKVEENKPSAPAKAAQNGQLGKRDKDSKSGKVVLIIDDSPTIRRVVSLTLERQGYQVVTAIDGVDGLTKLQENRVDIVLLDIMMPKLDGYQVCKAIREKKKSVPVIMLSGKDGFFDKVRGKMAGSTAYITKPFEQDALISVVKEHCAPA